MKNTIKLLFSLLSVGYVKYLVVLAIALSGITLVRGNDYRDTVIIILAYVAMSIIELLIDVFKYTEELEEKDKDCDNMTLIGMYKTVSVDDEKTQKLIVAEFFSVLNEQIEYDEKSYSTQYVILKYGLQIDDLFIYLHVNDPKIMEQVNGDTDAYPKVFEIYNRAMYTLSSNN